MVFVDMNSQIGIILGSVGIILLLGDMLCLIMVPRTGIRGFKLYRLIAIPLVIVLSAVFGMWWLVVIELVNYAGAIWQWLESNPIKRKKKKV